MIYLSEEEFEFLKRKGGEFLKRVGYFGKKSPKGRKGDKKEALGGSALRPFDYIRRNRYRDNKSPVEMLKERSPEIDEAEFNLPPIGFEILFDSNYKQKHKSEQSPTRLSRFSAAGVGENHVPIPVRRALKKD